MAEGLVAPPWRVWFGRAGTVLTVVCLVFLARQLGGHVRELPPVGWRWQALLAFAAATALLVANGALHALGWRTLVRALDPGASWAESYVVCGRSQLAKYLPGNALHYVQRMALARSAAVGLPQAAVVTVVDAMAVAAAAALVGLPALGHAAEVLARRGIELPRAAVVAAAVGAAAVAGLALRSRLRGLGPDILRVLAPRRVAAALLLNAALFVSAGAAIALLLRGFWPGQPALPWGELVPGFALAFLVGYVTPGSPGGIGVREAALYGLYEPSLGGALAAGLFVLSRVTFIVGDAVTFLAALHVHRRRTIDVALRKGAPEPPPTRRGRG